jgi:hypothetical protein
MRLETIAALSDDPIVGPAAAAFRPTPANVAAVSPNPRRARGNNARPGCRKRRKP